MIESELKIPVVALEHTRNRLAETGAHRLTAAELEVNVLFDTTGGDLASTRQVLRIRRIGGRSILTYKGPASWSGAVKQRREIELDVASAETAAELLHTLGYAPWMRYEKVRESWTLDDVRIDLDHTPMGDFVEVEGAPDALEITARRLGLDPSAAVVGSYVSLWNERRRQQPDLGRDMVFDS
jgi:adenylate cyclase class 2